MEVGGKGFVRTGALIALIIVFLAIRNSLQQSNFKSKFVEIDLYRNENNTGPVERVYIITTSDSIWNEMQRYSGLMPYSKLGTTKVYFFHEDSPYPKQAQGGRINFDPEFEAYCLAKYQKNNFGATSFSMFPFKK